MRNAESPPREIHGMSNTFFDGKNKGIFTWGVWFGIGS